MSALVDLLALALVVGYVWSGHRRGALLSILQVGGTIGAYIGAYAFSPAVAPAVARAAGVSNLVARLLAGAVLFILLQIVVQVVTRMLWRRRLRRETRVGFDSRLVGAGLGLLTGVLTITALLWVYDVVRVTAWGRSLPDISASYAARAARAVIRELTYAGVRARGGSERRAATLSRLASAPDQAFQELKSLLEEPSLRALLTSRRFQEDLESGEQARILADEDFQRLLRDERVMNRLRDFGLVPEHYRRPDYPEELAGDLAVLGRRIRAVREDPETRALVEELEQEGLMTWDGLLRLLRDPRFHKLLDRVLSPESGTGEGPGAAGGGD